VTRGKGLPLLVLALVLAAPGVAHAAELEVADNGDTAAIFYTAAAGEVNDLVITQAGGDYFFDEPFDNGAHPGTITVESGSPCVAVQPPDPGYFKCTPTSPVNGIVAALDDGNDEVTTSVSVPHTLTGGAGDDTLTGGAVADALFGGDGVDTLNGLAGDDQLRGDNGLDATPSIDMIDAGEGTEDLVFYNEAVGPVTVDLVAGTGGEFGAMDSLAGVENVFGNSSQSNTLTGNGQDNDLVGGSAEDNLDGGGGADLLVGHSAGDTLIAGGDAALDELTAGAGDDEVFAADGTGTGDIVNCGADADTGQADPGDTLTDCETIDTDPPLPPQVTIDLGDGHATQNTLPNLFGTASDNVDDATTVTVEIFEGDPASGAAVDTIVVNRAATEWFLDPNDLAGPLDEGVYTARVSQANPNTIPTTGTAEHVFEVDVTPPPLTLSEPVDNSTTDDSSPTIAGTGGTKGGLSADTHVTFELHHDTGPPVDEGTIDNGFWSIPKTSPFSTAVPVDLDPGTYHLIAYQADEAGNQAPSVSRTFTVIAGDDTPPALTVNAVGVLSDGTRWVKGSGASNPPTFSGSAGNAAGDEAEVTLFLDLFAGGDWNPTGSTTVTRSGGTWSKKWPTALGNGRYRVRAQQEDAEGNDTEVMSEFVVDSANPVVTLTAPTNNSATGSKRPTFSGAAGTAAGDLTTVRVELEKEKAGGGFDPVQGASATRSGGSWSFTWPRDLAPGRYSARARQADAAGNDGGSSFVIFTVVGPPKNVSNPPMSGPEAAIGAKLTGGLGTWTGGGNISYIGAFMRCPDTNVNNCEAIDGASGPWPTVTSYEIGRADVGQRIIWAVLAGNQGGLQIAYASHFTRIVPVPMEDTDQDGLSDFEETGPIDWNGDGVYDINLSEYGADPRHKDLFVEVDNMKTRQLRQDGVDIAVKTFARAPLSNPDGKNGITLHVDNGPDSIMNPVTGEKWGSKSESDTIPDKPVIVSGGTWDDFDELKGNLTPGRQSTFRYVINGFRHTSDKEGSSGKARVPEDDFRGSDMVVTLAGVQCDPGVTGCGDTETAHGGTFLHEFGHLIGLRHGGGDNVQTKPNYLSVMNYDFQFFGLRRRSNSNNLFDYSRWGSTGTDSLPNIDENALDELAGLKAVGDPDLFTTLVRCFSFDAAGEGVWDPVRTRFNVAVDFNCNGSKADGKVGESTINDDKKATVLKSFDDWENIRFEGGWVDSLWRASSGNSVGVVGRTARVAGAKVAQSGAGGLPDLPNKVKLSEPPASEILETTRILAGDAKKPKLKVKIKKRTLKVSARDNKALDHIRVTVGKKVYTRLAKTDRSKKAKLKVKLKKGKRKVVAVAIDRASNGAVKKLKRKIK